MMLARPVEQRADRALHLAAWSTEQLGEIAGGVEGRQLFLALGPRVDEGAHDRGHRTGIEGPGQPGVPCLGCRMTVNAVRS
jgi:hypothetical protein